MNKQIIPIMYTINNDYSIPMATCTVSLLENANRDYFYKFYVLNSDISKKNKQKILKSVEKFSDFSEIVFMDMKDELNDIWGTLKNKSHFSKEMFYKLLAPTVFDNLDKIIITDVDVVFLGDISKSYTEFDVSEDYYMRGILPVVSKDKPHGGYAHYLPNFSESEVEKMSNSCGAGYLVFNLKKMREDNLQETFFAVLSEKLDILIQPEQDVMGLCCHGKIKFLPLEYMLCTYTYDDIAHDKSFLKNVRHYTRADIEYAIKNTKQLHYACALKPWGHPNITKAGVWYEFFYKTDYKKIDLLKFRFSALKYKLYLIKRKIFGENI